MLSKSNIREAYWCMNCHVPLLGKTCNICSQEGKPFTIKAKPVFIEELNFLYQNRDKKIEKIEGMNALFKSRNLFYGKQGAYYKVVVKANDNGISCEFKLNKEKRDDRKKIIENPQTLSYYVPIDKQHNINSLENLGKIKKEYEDSSIIYDESYNEYIKNWDGSTDYEKAIIEANLPYLEELESEAIHFIQDTVKEYPSDRYDWSIGFSGGKDSTVVAYLVNQALKPEKIPLVFSNTTIEFDETLTFCELFHKKYQNPFFKLDGENDFLSICKDLGPPSRMMRWCCSTQKSTPLNKYQRTISKKILSFDGIRREESQLRSTYKRIQINTKVTRQVSVYPIIEWTDIQVWLYLLWRKIPFNEMYRKGFSRIGCWACPNNGNYDWVLSENFVPRFKEWKEFLLDFAKKNNKHSDWVYLGKWKERRVHYSFDNAINKNVCCLQEDDVYYTIKKPQPDLKEFLKIFGEPQLVDEKNQIYKIESEYLFVTFSPVDKHLWVKFNSAKIPPHFKYQFEKQFIKATNCINCGACSGSCSKGAIKFTPNFSIDMLICDGCKICTSSKFLGMGCVALHYKSDQTRIRNSFSYHHLISREFDKYIIGFPKKLYQKLKELGIADIGSFLKRKNEELMELTGFPIDIIEKNKKR